MSRQLKSQRRGVVVVNVAILLIPIIAFLALALDSGYLLKVRTELQSAADAAALAAVRELVPDDYGNQNTDQAIATARAYVQENVHDINAFQVNDSDIQIGRYDPSTIYSSVSLLNDGTYDTVRVTVRRDGTTNSAVRLFFARIIGIADCDVTATATAVLPRASTFTAGDGIMPFALHKDVWDATEMGDRFQTFNGHVVNAQGKTIPGNWGTVDIGETNNSTSELSDQIRNGLRQKDLDALAADGRIPHNRFLDATQPITVQADTGLSSGLKAAVEAIHGQTRYMPIYESVGNGNGNNAEYQIVEWGLVQVVGSNFKGAKGTNITFEKTKSYDGKLSPHPDLSDTSNTIPNVYAHPTLIE